MATRHTEFYEDPRFVEGVDYARCFRLDDSHPGTATIGPHGGGIEPGTSELCLAIAGPDYDYWMFGGIMSSGNGLPHITSCLRYVSAQKMTNTSVRERFGIDSRNSAKASRLIKEALDEHLIGLRDRRSPVKLREYVPWWAAPDGSLSA